MVRFCEVRVELDGSGEVADCEGELAPFEIGEAALQIGISSLRRAFDGACEILEDGIKFCGLRESGRDILR